MNVDQVIGNIKGLDLEAVISESIGNIGNSQSPFIIRSPGYLKTCWYSSRFNCTVVWNSKYLSQRVLTHILI